MMPALPHERQVASRERLDIFARTLLDGLADGVLAIAPDRTIGILNAPGAKILGCDVASVVGRTLAEVFLDDADNDAFLDAILAAGGRPGDSSRAVIAFDREDGERRLAIVCTSYRISGGPQAGELWLVVTFNDVTETLRLRDAAESLQGKLAAEHTSLQAAYRKIEGLVQRERQSSRRVGLIRTFAVLAVCTALVGVGAYNWQTGASAPTDATASDAADAATAVAVAEPIVSRVSVVGSIDPGGIVSVVSPVEGPVRTKAFEYGGSVERGQVLVRLDVSELELKLREAEGMRIKARQRADELRTWERGVDVSRARRAIAAAETEYASLLTRIKQTKVLLDKGIVPADEYGQLVQQRTSQAAQLDAARQDLAVIQDRGSEENRRIAEYELLNAQVKVDDIQRDISNATVLAPVSGVVLLPKETDNKKGDELTVGAGLSRGQSILSIGDLESFLVRIKIDEIDINQVRVGQAAVVTGDAFNGRSLDGVVSSVGAQATGDQAGRGGAMAVFPVSIKLNALTADQRARIHVGMSATVSITVYDNPAAIVIPPAAVQANGDARTATVVRDGRRETVAIVLGISTPTGVEVRSGIRPGDVVEFPR